MGFYTKSYLRGLSQKHADTSTFNDTVRAAKSKLKFDIFLSHSYRDKQYIEGLFYELTQMGLSVYVDWIIDSQLDRNDITKGTVNHIRNRMKQSQSLVYATSENASGSNWMPWELGFMDGDKGRCAVLPITDDEDDDFKGREFLSVYPYIKKNELAAYREDELNVYESTYNKRSISSWLSTY